jgi:DNA-binding response OmpR family regulator
MTSSEYPSEALEQRVTIQLDEAGPEVGLDLLAQAYSDGSVRFGLQDLLRSVRTAVGDNVSPDAQIAIAGYINSRTMRAEIEKQRFFASGFASISLSSRVLAVGNQTVQLKRGTFEIISELAANLDTTVEYEQLAEVVKAAHTVAGLGLEERILAVKSRVFNFRGLLDQMLPGLGEAKTGALTTVYRRGYLLHSTWPR